MDYLSRHAVGCKIRLKLIVRGKSSGGIERGWTRGGEKENRGRLE